MAFEPSELQTLTHLGLTSVQARVYLALAKYGPLKISSISKQSKVARPDVYRTLNVLNELGLVERIVETPVQFQAIPAEKCIELLLFKKTQEYDNLKKETEVLKNSFKLRGEPEEIQTSASRFLLIPQKAMVIKLQKEAIEASQKSIQTILSWKRFYHGVGEIFAASINNALSRKIEIKFLIEKPPTEELTEKAFEFCRKRTCKIRFLDKTPEAIVGVYDSKKIMILVDPMVDYPGASPALWTDNQSVVSLVKDYFETKWATAKSLPHAKSKKK
jgi:sugar-specific transcriptional regulator TrmB